MKTTNNINIKSSRNKIEPFQRKKVHNYLKLVLLIIVDFAAAQGNPESTAERHKSRTDSTNDNRKRMVLNNPPRKFNIRKPKKLKGGHRKDNGETYHEIDRRQTEVYTQFSKKRSTSKKSKAPPKKEPAKTNKLSQTEDIIEMAKMGQNVNNDDEKLTESVNAEDKYLTSIKNPPSNKWGAPDMSQFRTTSPSHSIEEEIPTSNKNIMMPIESVNAEDKYLISIKNPASNTWGTPDSSRYRTTNPSHESVPSALYYVPFSEPSEIQVKRPSIGPMQTPFYHPPLQAQLQSVDFTPFILQIATTSLSLLKEDKYFFDETKLYMEREYINYFENEYRTFFWNKYWI